MPAFLAAWAVAWPTEDAVGVRRVDHADLGPMVGLDVVHQRLLVQNGARRHEEFVGVLGRIVQRRVVRRADGEDLGRVGNRHLHHALGADGTRLDHVGLGSRCQLLLEQGGRGAGVALIVEHVHDDLVPQNPALGLVEDAGGRLRPLDRGGAVGPVGTGHPGVDDDGERRGRGACRPGSQRAPGHQRRQPDDRCDEQADCPVTDQFHDVSSHFAPRRGRDNASLGTGTTPPVPRNEYFDRITV